MSGRLYQQRKGLSLRPRVVAERLSIIENSSYTKFHIGGNEVLTSTHKKRPSDNRSLGVLRRTPGIFLSNPNSHPYVRGREVWIWNIEVLSIGYWILILEILISCLFCTFEFWNIGILNYPPAISSSSSTSFGMDADSTSWPSSVTRRSSSMRTPSASSRI